MRVYELARELGVRARDILLLLEELGVGGRTASSRVPPEHLDLIRVRLGPASGAHPPAEAAPAPKPAPASPPPAVKARKPGTAVAPPAEAPTEAPTEAPGVETEGDSSVVRIKPPVTVSAFAAALDTDADNVIKEAASLGEEVGSDHHISAELAVLIGEQWGYVVHVEAPEEEPPAAEPEAEEAVPAEAAAMPAEPEVEEAAPAAAVATEPVEVAVAPKRVVPRRVAAADAPSRPPVVTVMGHVDHGKTTLLDAIRQTNVTATEAGAITQHVGAYQVEINGRPITFIDTPGHEAFTAMRARGAQVTDIAVLIVAADDGVMPQTLEAVDHAQAAGVPIIVAINKVDRPSASLDVIKQRLSEKGLVTEEWGGETVFREISALQKTGIAELLDMILLVADMRELRARSEGPAEGVVLEAELDRRRGAVATLLIQEGTLKTGDSVVAGPVAGKVRAMMDDSGRRLKEAGPSTPVQIIGLSDVPEASELFRVVVSGDREARSLADAQRRSERETSLAVAGPKSMMDLSAMFAAGEAKVLNLILKADAHGTVEAIVDALIQMQTDEVKVSILHAGVGEVTESDVSLAAATKPTVIVAFQVGADVQARRLAADQQIEVRRYEVIYDLLDDIRNTMIGMLDVVVKEGIVGQAEVRALFHSSRLGTIAGCYVTEGRLVRGATMRVRRKGALVHEGRLDSLRHIRDDASEIAQGFECGVSSQEFNEFEVGDIIECVEEHEIRRTVL